jgi:hypothetical protein
MRRAARSHFSGAAPRKDGTQRPEGPALLAHPSSVRQPKILTLLASARSLVASRSHEAAPALCLRLRWLHAHVRQDEDRPFPGEAQKQVEADAGDAGRTQGPAQATPAPAHPERGGGRKRGARAPRLLRRNTTPWRPSAPGRRSSGTRRWYKALRRRSQRTGLSWKRMGRLATRWLPLTRMTQPFPGVRLDARAQGRRPVR